MTLGVGDIARVKIGGLARLDRPQLLVVDLEGDLVVTAWRDRRGAVHEHPWPTACLTRLSGPTWKRGGS